MLELVVAVLTWFVPAADAEALRRSAPAYLTVDTARAHVAAARFAAAVAGVDPDLVLAIAFSESRYIASTRTREPRGKTSCGVMTPVPRSRCVTPSLTRGYLEGASHLRDWLNACQGRVACAMRGYAGGWPLVRLCGERAGVTVAACSRVAARLTRARWLRWLRTQPGAA